jgi:hypothetical protein
MKKAQLVIHTSSGLEFQFIDAATDKPLSDRIFWCSDEDIENADDVEELEELGWKKMEALAAKNDLEIVERVWS